MRETNKGNLRLVPLRGTVERQRRSFLWILPLSRRSHVVSAPFINMIYKNALDVVLVLVGRCPCLSRTLSLS